MIYYLIPYRSLTHAQRTDLILERSGITSHVVRSPNRIGEGGCGYAVKVLERHWNQALEALKRADRAPAQVWMASEDGSYREASL